MSESAQSTQKKMLGAANLKAVVRTMKAMASSNIVQFENSVLALEEYYRTVELGLQACFNADSGHFLAPESNNPGKSARYGAIVFGSDQGLVGQFNESIAEFAATELSGLPGTPLIWAVGERVHEHLSDSLSMAGLFFVPNSVRAITSLVNDILLAVETMRSQGAFSELYVFYNNYSPGSIFQPVRQRLLPLDETWLQELQGLEWPTICLPEVLGSRSVTTLALIHEFLFVSLFRACAGSLASENASRLAAMQRADKNIGELLEDLNRTFQDLRQSSIDEELFEVVSSFEMIRKPLKDKL